MTQRVIQTVDGVIDALGGTGATAEMTSRKPQHVSNWRAEKRLAGETFLVLQEHLSERNLTAPPSLWGITKSKKRWGFIKSKRRKKPARKS